MNKKELELELLNMWNRAGVVDIYRFGNLIKWYEPDKKIGVTDRTLMTDFRGDLFRELSTNKHGMVSDVKEVQQLIKERLNGEQHG